MKTAAKPDLSDTQTLHMLPRWVTSARDQGTDAVAFTSGAALEMLDVVVRDPSGTLPGALLRDRMALNAAVACLKGRKFWLWRAVDQNGLVLDEILQCRRNTRAAKRLLVRLMKKHTCVPKRFITDKLRSYGAAKREIAPGVEHRSHKGLNNRAENSH